MYHFDKLETYPGGIFVNPIVHVDSEPRIQISKRGDTSGYIENAGRSFKCDVIVENFIPVGVAMAEVLTCYGVFIPVMLTSTYMISITNSITPQ